MVKRRDLLKVAAAAPMLALPGSAAAFQEDEASPENVPLSHTPDGGLLPQYRILSYYGFPGNEFMGILGEYDKETLLQKLQEQANAYLAVDDSRPIKLAFEVIASVAQRDPQPDGSYLAYISPDVIDEYVEFTRQNDLILLLDMQFGRKTVQEEMDAVAKWLEEPHVHIALDPEFSIEEGEVPGEHLGSIDAAEIRYAQDYLIALSERLGIPRKLLIIHQFNWYSISNKDKIEPMVGVDFVLEVDGWGPPELKLETYEVLTQDPIEYHGFKLWYKQDVPLMSEADVLALEPTVDLIIYQ